MSTPPPRGTEEPTRGTHTTWVWVSVFTALLLATVAATANLLHQPWLITGLGPSAYLHALYPRHPEATFFNTTLGHLLGAAGGIIAVLVMGKVHLPDPYRPLAFAATAGLAILLTVLGQFAYHAHHAPGLSTALVFSFGGLPANVVSLVNLMIGVFLLALLGEGIRYIRCWQLGIACTTHTHTDPGCDKDQPPPR